MAHFQGQSGKLLVFLKSCSSEILHLNCCTKNIYWIPLKIKTSSRGKWCLESMTCNVLSKRSLFRGHSFICGGVVHLIETRNPKKEVLRDDNNRKLQTTFPCHRWPHCFKSMQGQNCANSEYFSMSLFMKPEKTTWNWRIKDSSTHWKLAATNYCPLPHGSRTPHWTLFFHTKNHFW